MRLKHIRYAKSLMSAEADYGISGFCGKVKVVPLDIEAKLTKINNSKDS